jgi:hypothetical protein
MSATRDDLSRMQAPAAMQCQAGHQRNEAYRTAVIHLLILGNIGKLAFGRQSENDLGPLSY